MNPAAAKSRRHRVTISVLIGVVIAILLLSWQRQAIYDWSRLHDYQAPAAIAALASDDTMTAAARHMYYVNHPVLKSKSTFAQFCPSGTELLTVVLGCYKGGEQGIYVLQVNSSELAGIEQVTAAHEMLHAAYERLPAKEKKTLDAELIDYYKHGLHDDSIKQVFESYKKTEPNDVVNEMHSIFGTEVADLPPALEKHYQQYFTDRSKVTGYYAAYQQAFTSRQAQIKNYDDQLSTWKSQIDQLQGSLKSQQQALQSQHNALNGYRSSGNIGAYNAGVDSYNAAVARYNSDLEQLKNLINQYNQMVNQRNSIAFEEQSLVRDITATPIQ